MSGMLRCLLLAVLLSLPGATAAQDWGGFDFQSNSGWDCEMGNAPGAGAGRGLGPVRNRAISPGWYYNNDWGRLSMRGIPPIRSCIRRDGAGWLLDVAPFRLNGERVYYHSPTLLFGHKGWGFAGNRLARGIGFPVRVRDIARLDFAADFDFTVLRRGQMNTHVSLWFVKAGGPVSAAWRKAPFFEMMLKIVNDQPVDLCQRRGTRAGAFRIGGRSVRYCYRSNEAFFHDHNSLETNLHDARRGISGRHAPALDLAEVVAQAVDKGYVGTDDILLGVEFQTEVAFGAAQLSIRSLSVRLDRK